MKRLVYNSILLSLFFVSPSWAQSEGYPQSDYDAQILRDRAREKWDHENGVTPASAAPVISKAPEIESMPEKKMQPVPSETKATPVDKTSAHQKNTRHSRTKSRQSHKAKSHKKAASRHTHTHSRISS